jgi:hypothetical protein
MAACGANARTTSAATAALLWLTCWRRNRNWRFRLLVSMVSRSIWGRWFVGRARRQGRACVVVVQRSEASAGGAGHRRTRLLLRACVCRAWHTAMSHNRRRGAAAAAQQHAHHFYAAEASQHQRLEQLAADAASAHRQHTRPRDLRVRRRVWRRVWDGVGRGVWRGVAWRVRGAFHSQVRPAHVPSTQMCSSASTHACSCALHTGRQRTLCLKAGSNSTAGQGGNAGGAAAVCGVGASAAVMASWIGRGDVWAVPGVWLTSAAAAGAVWCRADQALLFKRGPAGSSRSRGG